MRCYDLIIDCQFGSTGKGLIAGYLAKKNRPDTIITAWAPNAGHTFIDENGRKFVHTMLGNGIVSPGLKRVMIGPGSVIDVHALLAELNACSDLVSVDQVIIHPQAAVVSQRHRDEEAGPMTKIGSTKKGTGAAMIQRIRRNPEDLNNAATEIALTPLSKCLVTVKEWHEIMHDEVEYAQVESAQGYSLSMYNGFYPYTTSRDVSTAQTIADCGLPYGVAGQIIGTCRTFPIRVANRFDTDGKQVGWSGPHYDDQEETSFEAIGQKTELTTVTKLPRRIFTYSKEQIRQAVRVNGVTKMFLNFANYATQEQLDEIANHIESLTDLNWLGWGPTEEDVRRV
jgi:adenylosuccinate synthase